MFNWLKKKKKEPELAALLKLDDIHFGNVVGETILKEDPSGTVMILVAYANLTPILGAAKVIAKEHSLSDLPQTLDEHLYKIADRIENDKMNERALRRSMRFFTAGLLKRATEKASANPELRDIMIEAWFHIIKNSSYTAHILKTNILWSDVEKGYFSDINDELSGMKSSYLDSPSWVQHHPLVQKFAKEEIYGYK
jgi:hypothetical protein